jgi:hypothetical protein
MNVREGPIPPDRGEIQQIRVEKERNREEKGEMDKNKEKEMDHVKRQLPENTPPIVSAWKARGGLTSMHARSFIAVAMVFGLVHALSGSATTTLDPNKVEVVTSDVAHFWRAFDDSARVPTV